MPARIPRVSRWTLVRLGGIAALLVPATVWSSLIVFGLLNDEFRLIAYPVSDLGVLGAPHATAFNVTYFFATGLLILVLAAGMLGIGRGLTTLAAALLVVCGVTFIASGIVHADPASSSAMAIHQAIGTVLLWTMPLVPLAAGGCALRRGARRYGRFSIGIAGLLAAVGLLVLILPASLQAPVGVYQRAWLLVSSVWFIVTGAQMARPGRFATPEGGGRR